MAERKDDPPVKSGSQLTILRAITAYKDEAEAAKRTRLAKNKMNFQAYLGQQDWSHKQKGQSTEFLPKTPVAVEQWSSFVKRALTQFGPWFSVDSDSRAPLTSAQIAALIDTFLEDIPKGRNKRTTFAGILSDAIKCGLLEALVTLKVHGQKVTERQFVAERGARWVERDLEGQHIRYPVAGEAKLKRKERQSWKLLIDIVRADEYFPDPTGKGLYEIHSVERDLSDVQELADQGVYDPAVVDEIRQDFAKAQDEWERARQRNQDVAQAPAFRKRVYLDEFWGDILDEDGRLVEHNIVATVANEKYLIRPPEPNPFWHNLSPFVSAPIVSVPGSVWHKAMYDHAVGLNFAQNELFNLMLDGSLAGVWGVRQVRPDCLLDPRQVSGGIPQGATLAIKEDTPVDVKVVESLTQSVIPPEALQMFMTVDRFFDMATQVNDIKLGLLPPKQVKATEVVESQQSQAVGLDAVASDIERNLIGPVLYLSWMNILQNADDLATGPIVQAIGPRGALALARMNPAERFSALGNNCGFRVHGLSATLSRVRDFQKLMAYVQAVTTNPLLLQAFSRRFSPDKLLTTLMKLLNINPSHLEMDPDEMAQMPANLQQMPFFQGLTSTKPGGTMTQETVGEPGLPAEINALSNPMTQLGGAG